MQLRQWINSKATCSPAPGVPVMLPTVMINAEGKNNLNSSVTLEDASTYMNPEVDHDVFVSEDNGIYIKGEAKYIGPVAFKFDELSKFDYLTRTLAEDVIDVSEDDIYKPQL